MTIEDIPQVIECGSQESNFSVTDTTEGFWSIEQLENTLKENNDVLLVAEQDECIVGFCISLIHQPTGKATFENLWVHEEFRKSGVGQLLFGEMVKELKKKQVRLVCALIKEGNNPILAFMDKNEFEKGNMFFWLLKEL